MIGDDETLCLGFVRQRVMGRMFDEGWVFASDSPPIAQLSLIKGKILVVCCCCCLIVLFFLFGKKEIKLTECLMKAGCLLVIHRL